MCRLVSPDRSHSTKLTDVSILQSIIAQEDIFTFGSTAYTEHTVDTTSMNPKQTAESIYASLYGEQNVRLSAVFGSFTETGIKAAP